MVPFHRPDGRCMSAFMLFRSFMIEMSQAAVNDLLSIKAGGSMGGAVFFLLPF